ncbi:MAG: thiamine-monophosphate kinase [Victivallales bacterium]|nr:thiamine-monophosphate kinase [Victivallales bacterium]
MNDNPPPSGEDAFFDQLFHNLPKPPPQLVLPPGDDCAAWRMPDGNLLLLAVDQLIGDRHYLSQGEHATSPERAGRKLLARNLSDIAAMGGIPTTCLLAAAFAPTRGQEWISRYYNGILRLAKEYNVAMVGGDLATTARGDDIGSITILGTVEPQNLLKRSGAHAGDLLFATGTFGSSFPTEWHLDFTPRCQEGRWLATHHFASACMDVSDGLLLDLARMCRASHTGLVLELPNIPRRTHNTTLQQACTDGEDYELIFAVPPEKMAPLQKEWPFSTKLTCLGYFDDSLQMTTPDGNTLTPQGWDHLTSKAHRDGDST